MSTILKCSFCTYSTNRAFNLRRHITTRHETELNCSDDDPQIVTISPPNVTIIPPNVTIIPPNVTIPPPNVTIDPPNVTIVQNEHKCDICNKVCSTSWNLKRHSKRCTGSSSSLECTKCKKVFQCRQHKSRHMRTCTGLSTSIIPVDKQELQVHTTNNNSSIQTQMNQCTLNNTTNVNNNNNNVQININCYGKENVQHITSAFKDARLQEFNGKGILNYIKQVHFNAEHPENHNIRKHDKTFCKIYDDGEWTLHSMKLALSDLIKTYRMKLFERLYELDDEEPRTTCDVSLKLISDNLMKFDRDRNPVDFYSVMQGIVALINNLESMYKEERFKHAVENMSKN